MDDEIDTLAIVELVVEHHVVGGSLAGDLGGSGGPEDGCSAHALLFGEGPERRAAVPGAIGSGVAAVVVIGGVAGGIEEAVGYDAVVFRVEAGNDGVVVGEGERWDKTAASPLARWLRVRRGPAGALRCIWSRSHSGSHPARQERQNASSAGLECWVDWEPQ